MSRLTYEELEAAWQALPKAPRDKGTIVLLVLRRSVAQLAKRDRPQGYNVLRAPYHQEPKRITLDPAEGIVGDRWHPKRNKVGDQLSLTSVAVSRLITDSDQSRFHLSGDNLVVDFDLSAAALPVGTQLSVGNAVIEISDEPHTPCNRYQARFGKDARRWVNDPAHAERHLRGRYAQIISAGDVAVGASISRLQ